MNFNAKQAEIRNWLRSQKVTLFGLVETRVKDKNADIITRVFDYRLFRVDN